MKNVDFKAVRMINGVYQDEIEEGFKANSIAHAIELFAIKYLNNHEILNLGNNEYSVTGKNEAGKTIEYCISNIQVK